MRRSRVLRIALIPLLLLLQAAFFFVGPQGASAAVAQLPFTVTNNSGRGDATYIYVIARNSAGQQGYVDSGGTWHAFGFPSSTPNGPVPAPDVSIAGPANGASSTVRLAPSLAGGRIYLSMGSKLSFFLTTNGLVEPAPWVPSDPNANVLYDWTEFARASNNGNGIFINTTTVDMFSIPLTVSVTSSAGSTQTQGISGNRSGIFSAVSGLGSPWTGLITTRSSDGLPLRVLAPVHGIANGTFSSTYLDSYVSAVWSYYASHTLTVQTSLGNFTGTTSGNNWAFRDGSGNVVGTLTKPSTSDVFACSGGTQPQGQPNETAILAVGARVCAALNRATLSTASRAGSDTQPTTNAATFYGQTASNLYSKTIHANSLNGLAYGFSYDDVGGFAPVIDQSDPSSAGMTIGSFGTGGGSTGGGGTGGGSATATTQAEAFSAQSGTVTEACSDTGGGSDVGSLTNGDWLQYNNINFGASGLHTFTARVASGAGTGVSGTVEVHLDSLSNPSIGSFSVGNTGGWQTWKSVPGAISTTTGTHTVFLKFVTGSGQDFVNVNWFNFS